MILIWKNKGFVILLYVVFSIIGSAICGSLLSEKFDFEFIEYIKVVLGIAFNIAGLLTYLTRYDYYKDRQGKKVKMDVENSLFFIKMEYWHYILCGLGIFLIIMGLI